MKRRNFLTASAVAATTAAASAAFPTPALAQNSRRLRMVTSWPKGFPGLAASAESLAEKITEATAGALDIKVYESGELMSAFEVFDAVSRGEVDIYHSAEAYWRNRSEAYSFFSAIPFGMTVSQFNAWIYYGGGQGLWDELSEQYNIKPHLCANTGTQWGGWFSREVKSVEDFNGLNIRLSGLGAAVLENIGANVIQLPGDEILNALENGSIDAAEWVGPWNDLAFGFHDVAKYYYWPGFHGPSTGECAGFNLDVWNSLSHSQRSIVETVCAAENEATHSSFLDNNAVALRTLKNFDVELREFSDSQFAAFYKATSEVMEEIADADAFVARVWDSYRKSQESTSLSLEHGEFAYLSKLEAIR